MGQLMTHEVTKQYNWSGKSGWKGNEEQEQKSAFGSLELSALTTSKCYTIDIECPTVKFQFIYLGLWHATLCVHLFGYITVVYFRWNSSAIIILYEPESGVKVNSFLLSSCSLWLFPDAIMKNPLFSTTKSTIEKQIGAWLRGAGDRNGGRKERAARKAAEKTDWLLFILGQKQ